MGAIYFSLLTVIILGFLAIPAEPRTFPGDQTTAVVMIYERSSPSGLPLDLSAILAAVNHEENGINNNDLVIRMINGRAGGEVRAPIPHHVPPSPKPAPPKSEFTSMAPADDEEEGCDSANGTDDCISMVTAGVPSARRKPSPPPAPKPATPTHPTI